MIKKEILLNNFIKFILLFIFLQISTFAFSQINEIKGKIVDDETNIPIEHASILIKNKTIGCFSKIDGTFELTNIIGIDSLVITYIGYIKKTIKITNSNIGEIRLKLKKKDLKEVIVKVTHGDRAESLIKQVLIHKINNNPNKFKNYTFNSYNKAELDLKNYSVIHKNSLQGKMQNSFNKLDTSNISKKVLPIYFIETLTKNYHSSEPEINKEQIIAKKSLGLETDILIRRLEKFTIYFNIYDNWLPIFDKTFASPIADNGFAFYKYYFDDSIKENGHTIYTISFEPRNSYEAAFKGYMLVNDKTFSISKIYMVLTSNANLNYIKNFRFNQEFELFPNNENNELVYMPKKYTTDLQFEAGLDLLGIPVPPKSDAVKMNYINTKVFDSIKINTSEPKNIIVELKNQDSKNQFIKDEVFWKKNRLDTLSIHEESIYKMIDTMKKNSFFDFSTKVAAFAGTGFWDIKNKLRFGPYSSFISKDKVEGIRMRCGFWTLPAVNEKWNLNGYLAYGFKDNKFKGGLGIKYIHSKTNWNKTFISAKSDYDVIIDYDDELDRDNILSSILRKNVPSFRSYIQEIVFGHEHQITKNIMSHSSLSYKIYNPVFNFSYHPEDRKTDLPIDTAFKHILPLTEFNTNIRITKNQKTVIVNYDLLNLTNYNPILNIGYTYGIEIGKSEFSYHKFTASIEQNLRVPPKMYLFYKLSTGITFGTAPYIILNVPRGNEFYVSSKYSFNTMVPYEFASDKFISLQTRFSGGGILLDKIPLLKKLGWRERITFNSFMGGLSQANQKFNSLNTINVANKVPYIEAGIGLENIFHSLSIEYIKRFTYLNNPYAKQSGLYLGVQLNF